MTATDQAATGDELNLRTGRAVTWAMIAASGVGAFVVLVFLVLILPAPAHTPIARAVRLNLLVFALYLPSAALIGARWGRAIADKRLTWLRAGHVPDGREQRQALRLPLALLIVPATLWSEAAVVFGAINTHFSAELAGRVVTTIVLGALTTCGLSYLLAERVMRAVSARALAGGPPLRPVAPGVVVRTVLAWALASGVAVAGIGLVAIGVIRGDTPASDATAWSILFLVGVALVFGMVAIVAAARSVAEPIRSVRSGLAEIEAGHHEAEVPVYDASEVGLLQAGFNRMAAGLRERERIRDLFGRHVGVDVARRALEREFELGGELREAAVLFVDIIGSTALAAQAPPQSVVQQLNTFFSTVLEAVEAHGGWINKFEGDAALCVFGVPTPDEDAAGHALAAARALAERLDRGDALAAGIGVAAGMVVAGNIGVERRFEYTVIGDAVNEAARLTELAKDRPRRVLASEAAVRKASAEEAARWSLQEEVTLRGRQASTRLATPAG